MAKINGAYELVLTADEAQALFAVLRKVAGNKEHTRRKHTQSIHDSMESLGVFSIHAEDIQGEVAFKELDEKKKE